MRRRRQKLNPTDQIPKQPRINPLLRPRYIILGILLLLMGLFSLYKIHLSRQVTSRLDGFRKAGFPITFKELDQWYSPVPPEQNAAEVICRAACLYVRPDQTTKDSPIVYQGYLLTRNENLSSHDKKILIDLTRANQPAIELLRHAAGMPQSRFPVDLSGGFGVDLPHLSHVKYGSRLLYFEGVLNVEAGKMDSAAGDVLAILGIARSLLREPADMSQCIRLSTQQTAVQCFERILNHGPVSEDSLLQIQQTLGHALSERAEGPCLAWNLCLSHFVYSSAEAQKAMLQLLPSIKGSSIFYSIPGGDFLLFMSYVSGGNWEKEYLQFLDFFEDRIKISELPYPQKLKAVKIIASTSFYPTNIFAEWLNESFWRTEALAVAHLRMAQIATAIERYRHTRRELPSSLESLVPDYLETIPLDPFDVNENPIRFKLLEKGYMVYSIGDDGKDDGGREKSPPTSTRYTNLLISTGYTKDIPFIVER